MVAVKKTKEFSDYYFTNVTQPIAQYALDAAQGMRFSLFINIINELLLSPKSIIPEPTLSRRKKAGIVKADEAEIALRILRIYKLAEEVFGDKSLSRQFLVMKHPMLKMISPLDMALKGESGGKVVENLIGQIAAGVAA